MWLGQNAIERLKPHCGGAISDVVPRGLCGAHANSNLIRKPPSGGVSVLLALHLITCWFYLSVWLVQNAIDRSKSHCNGASDVVALCGLCGAHTTRNPQCSYKSACAKPSDTLMLKCVNVCKCVKCHQKTNATVGGASDAFLVTHQQPTPQCSGANI